MRQSPVCVCWGEGSAQWAEINEHSTLIKQIYENGYIYCHNPNNKTLQHCCWVGHENDCADPTPPPQKLNGSPQINIYGPQLNTMGPQAGPQQQQQNQKLKEPLINIY